MTPPNLPALIHKIERLLFSRGLSEEKRKQITDYYQELRRIQRTQEREGKGRMDDNSSDTTQLHT